MKDKSYKTSQTQTLQRSDKVFQTSDYYRTQTQQFLFGEDLSTQCAVSGT